MLGRARRTRPRPRRDGHRQRVSASFVMLRALVARLPVMITPRWVDTRTQPVAIEDVAGTLAALADLPDPPPRCSSAAPTSSPTAR